MSLALSTAPARQKLKSSLLEVAAELVHNDGLRALTTRGVAHAAGVQAPMIYRIFGDKDGLLDALAEHVFATYIDQTMVHQEGEQATDPVTDLRYGWDLHVGFGLANPAVFGLLTDPQRATPSPAAANGRSALHRRIHRLAGAGMLAVDEALAVDLIHSAGTGAVLTLLARREDQRDRRLTDAMFDAVAASILSDSPWSVPDDAATATVAFRTVVPRLTGLTEQERGLMLEWLGR